MMLRPPSSTLFPYTTLFRSERDGDVAAVGRLQFLGIDQQHFGAGRVAGVELVEVLTREPLEVVQAAVGPAAEDRKSTRLNSSHSQSSYAVFGLKQKNVEDHD